MSRLFFFLSPILFFTSLNAAAKETCSSKDLLDRSCAFYEKNSDKEFFITSGGQKFRNPSYVPSQQAINSLKDGGIVSRQNGNTITAMYPALDDEKMAAQMDSMLELSINTENILSKTEAKKLPIKSFRSVANYSVIFQILQSAFPAEKAFQTGEGFKIYIPKPINDPKGKMSELTSSDVEDLKKTIGAENLGKLKAIYLEQAKNVTYNPYPAVVPPKPATRFLSEQKFNESNKRIANLQKYTQAKLINLIKNGRSDSQLSAEQKSLIKKIETVQYINPRDPRAESTGECAKGGAAYYFPPTHSVTFCEGIYDLPDSQVVQILSHEMGHSIDPCVSQNFLHEVNTEKLEQLLRQDAAPNENRDSEAVHLTNEIVKKLKQTNRKYINEYNDLTLDPPVEKALTESGVITRISNGVTEKNYPFNSVRACLIKEENIDDITSADIDAEINYLRSYKKRTGTLFNKEEEQGIRAAKNRLKTCAGTNLKISEVNEAMCDFFGSFAQAEYLNDYPPKNETDAFASMSFFTADSCRNNPKLQSAHLDHMASLQEPHPHSFRRLHSVFFKMPGIADHFGCELKPKSKCFVNQEHLLSKKSNSSNKEAGQK